MKLIKSISILLFFILFTYESFAQEDKRYVIQLATYSSMDAFVKEKDKYPASDQVWVEKIGKTVKVYLLHYDGQYDDYSLFYPGESLENASKWTKKEFKGAFRRSDVKKDNLKMAYEIFKEYKDKKVRPSEYTSKGEPTEIDVEKSSKYKIQLGVFQEQKSLDYIADNYGLSNFEKNKVEEFLTHDFKKVKKVICRRYFFGDFDTKASALAKMKAMEKKTKRKLLLVRT